MNRSVLAVLVGVGAVVFVVLAVVLASDSDDDSQTSPSTTVGSEPAVTGEIETTTVPPPDTTETTIPTTAEDQQDQSGSGDVSALEVIEKGFSTYTGPVGDAAKGSFGFLVENTGDETVVGAPLSVTITDEGGGTIETASFTIGVIRSGETLGYGTEVIQNPTNGIGDIQIQIGESIASYEAPAEGTLTVSDVNTSRDDFTTTTFSVSSTYSEQVDFAEPYAIYRDADGRIIGGAEGFMDFIPPGGQQTAEVTLLAAIPNVATTEAYVDPGQFF